MFLVKFIKNPVQGLSERDMRAVNIFLDTQMKELYKTDAPVTKQKKMWNISVV
jgi:hypothetical protein